MADNLNSVSLPQDVNSWNLQALRPYDAGSVTLAATTATGNVALPTVPGPAGTAIQAQVIEISTTASVMWQFGGSAVTAAVTNKLLPGTGTAVYRVPAGVTKIAAITPTATATVTLVGLY